MFGAIRGKAATHGRRGADAGAASGPGPRVLLVDHEDTFVHTLAELHPHDRRRGRDDAAGLGARGIAAGQAPDLVVLSPGPGRPADFAMAETLELLVGRSAAGVRRLPRPARDRRIFRRRRSTCWPCRCTASRRRSGCSAAGCCAVCRTSSPSAATIRLCPAQHPAGGVVGHRRDRGRRDHGDRARRSADRRRAVSSRIGDDPRRTRSACRSSHAVLSDSAAAAGLDRISWRELTGPGQNNRSRASRWISTGKASAQSAGEFVAEIVLHAGGRVRATDRRRRLRRPCRLLHLGQLGDIGAGRIRRR